MGMGMACTGASCAQARRQRQERRPSQGLSSPLPLPHPASPSPHPLTLPPPPTDLADLGAAEHLAQAPHERPVHAHQLLLVHLVRLVQDHAHLGRPAGRCKAWGGAGMGWGGGGPCGGGKGVRAAGRGTVHDDGVEGRVALRCVASSHAHVCTEAGLGGTRSKAGSGRDRPHTTTTPCPLPLGLYHHHQRTLSSCPRRHWMTCRPHDADDARCHGVGRRRGRAEGARGGHGWEGSGGWVGVGQIKLQLMIRDQSTPVEQPHPPLPPPLHTGWVVGWQPLVVAAPLTLLNSSLMSSL